MTGFIGEKLQELIDNGGAGGSCVVTDLGEQDGHLPAQNTIIELLKPDSVPQGYYIYIYWASCAGNSALAIAYKCNSHITCSQISSNGEIRKFTYEFSPENVIEQCFRPMGVEILTNTGDSQTAVMSQKAVTDALANAGVGEKIIGITAQGVRITNLDSGIYRLTYEGRKDIYYYGATGANTLIIKSINPIYLYVNKKQDSADGTAYWDWYFIGCTEVGNYALAIYYGITDISSGQYGMVIPQTIIEIEDIINNLEESTYYARRALSAYQGYVLDQNKQNKTDETLETTDKTIVGAINELNGKIGTGSGGSNLSFLPEPILLDGYTYTPTKGETITIKRKVDIGTYAIFQPYSGITYQKRVLANCVSATTETVQPTAVFGYDTGYSPSVGQPVTIYNNGGWSNVGDYIVINWSNLTNGTSAWVLAQTTKISLPQYTLTIIAILPEDYDSTSGIVEFISSTFEVLTVLDAVDNNSVRYFHKIQVDTMDDFEAGTSSVGIELEVNFLLEESNTFQTDDELRTLGGKTPISGYLIRKTSTTTEVAQFCRRYEYGGPTGQNHRFYFITTTGEEINLPVNGVFTDTVTMA